MSDPSTTTERSSPSRQGIFLFAGLSAALVIVRFALGLSSDVEWWGFNLGRYLDSPIQLLLALTALAGIGWSVRAPASSSSDQPAVAPHRLRDAAIVAGFGLLFFVGALPFSLLGDSTMFGGELFRNFFFGIGIVLHRAPLAMLMETTAFWVQRTLGISSNVYFAFRITGAFCGMGFVAVAMALSRRLFAGRSGQVLAFILFLTCGGTLLFFGYVETYALEYALVLAYCYAIVEYVQGRMSVRIVGLILGCCVLAHYQHVLLLPSFAALIMVKRYGDRGATIVYRSIAVSFPVMLAVYAAAMYSTGTAYLSGNNPLIPFRTIAGVSYTLLSAQHVRDILNEHVLIAAVPTILIAAIALAYRAVINWRSPAIVATITLIWFGEAFLWGGYFELGLARDWDVSSSLGIMLAFLAALLVRQAAAHGLPLRPLAIGVSATAIAAFLSWYIVNDDESSSQARYEHLVEMYAPSLDHRVTRFGYENLRKDLLRQKDYLGELRIDKRMVEILPYHFDAQRALSIMEQHGKELGPQGAEIVRDLVDEISAIPSDSTLRSEVAGDEGQIRLGPHGSAEYITLGDLFFLGVTQQWQIYGTLTDRDAQQRADAFILRHPTLPFGYELLSRISFTAKKYSESQSGIDRAIAADPDRARPYFFRANNWYDIGAFDSARVDLHRCLSRDPQYLNAWNGMSVLLRDHPRPAAEDSADIQFARRGLNEYLRTHTPVQTAPELINEANLALRNLKFKM